MCFSFNIIQVDQIIRLDFYPLQDTYRPLPLLVATPNGLPQAITNGFPRFQRRTQVKAQIWPVFGYVRQIIYIGTWVYMCKVYICIYILSVYGFMSSSGSCRSKVRFTAKKICSRCVAIVSKYKNIYSGYFQLMSSASLLKKYLKKKQI